MLELVPITLIKKDLASSSISSLMTHSQLRTGLIGYRDVTVIEWLNANRFPSILKYKWNIE